MDFVEKGDWVMGVTFGNSLFHLNLTSKICLARQGLALEAFGLKLGDLSCFMDHKNSVLHWNLMAEMALKGKDCVESFRLEIERLKSSNESRKLKEM